MKLPFTHEQFLAVFERYNTAIWPAQILLNAVALLAVYFLFKRSGLGSIVAGSIITALWIWTGVVYHLMFFTSINSAAYLFGIMFVVQGLLLAAALRNKTVTFRFGFDAAGMVGMLMVFYALILYPLAGYFLGRTYPYSPTFGAPCPVTILTFGFLLNTSQPMRWTLLIIPLLWSFIGISAAINLSIKEDFGLAAAGIVTVLFVIYTGRKQRVPEV